MNPNQVERKDLEVGKLYWLADVSDYNQYPTPVMVKVLDVSPDEFWKGQLKVKVREVLTAEIKIVPQIYMEFEAIHPSWLGNKKATLVDQIERLKFELEMYQAL